MKKITILIFIFLCNASFAQQYEMKTILSGTASLAKMMSTEKSAVTLYLNLPQNTVSWSYNFSVWQDYVDAKSSEQSDKSNKAQLMSLLEKGADFASNKNMAAFLVNNLTERQGSQKANIYLLDQKDYYCTQSSMGRKIDVPNKCYRSSSRFASQGARVDFPDGTRGNQFLLMLENTNIMQDVYVTYEVVAIVRHGWGPLEKQNLYDELYPQIQRMLPNLETKMQKQVCECVVNNYASEFSDKLNSLAKYEIESSFISTINKCLKAFNIEGEAEYTELGITNNTAESAPSKATTTQNSSILNYLKNKGITKYYSTTNGYYYINSVGSNEKPEKNSRVKLHYNVYDLSNKFLRSTRGGSPKSDFLSLFSVDFADCLTQIGKGGSVVLIVPMIGNPNNSEIYYIDLIDF